MKGVMDLQSALRPLRLASRFLGLNIERRFGRVYTFFVFLLIVMLICASFIYIASGDIQILSKVDSLILWTQFTTNGITVLVILGTSLFKPRQFLFPIQKMRKADAVLRILGVEISNAYLRRIQLVQISFLCFFLLILESRNLYEIIQRRSLLLILHCMYYGYVVLSSTLIDCLFVNYLAVIRGRFSKLNQLLKEILNSNKNSFLNFNVFYVNERGIEFRNRDDHFTQNIKSTEKLRLLHYELCDISRKVNESFGLQLLIGTTISLIMVTGQLYEAYHFITSIENPGEIAVQKFMWITFYVVRLFHISYACICITNEANTTASIIHKISIHQLSNGMSEQIQHFSLQLLHENLNFTACGFFDIDFGLLCAITGVVTTYMVILIQMDGRMIHSR